MSFNANSMLGYAKWKPLRGHVNGETMYGPDR